MTLLVNTLLALAVLATWLGCLGFARLRTALDRLHCIMFVNALAGLSLAAAALAADGPSSRAAKAVLIVLVGLLAGAAASHASGRAIMRRELAVDDGGEDRRA